MRPKWPLSRPSFLTVFALCLALLVASSFVCAELVPPLVPLGDELINAEHVKLEMSAAGEISLVGKGKGDELRVTIQYVPADAQELTAVPNPQSLDPLVFSWKSVVAGKYAFRYDSVVTNYAERVRISKAIPYPYAVPADITPYLQAHEYTDTNDDIKALASQLSAGETDSVRVVHKLASWTRTNIVYNLTSIAADASERSSWVMEHREGVCDELTALFISLSREAGIPARFVSGVAYTTLAEFPEPWQAHGWAEVWLPDYGWVPVDVTYGEVFWLDATHVPIIKSADARNTAADYSLRARDLTLQPTPFKTTVNVLSASGNMQEPIRVKLDPQYRRTGSASGNVLIATVTNDAAYTVATDVALATTTGVIVHDSRNQMLLLPAGATRLVHWRVTMPSYEPGYEYTVPFGVYVQRGANATANVTGAVREIVYPLPLADNTAENDGGLVVRCATPEPLYPGEHVSVTCEAPGARICADSCAQDSATVTFDGVEPGAYPFRVNATLGSTRGHALVTFIVAPRPAPHINATVSRITSMDDTATLAISVRGSALTQARVVVDGGLVQHDWDLDELADKEFALEFPAALLDAGANTITITVFGNDKNGVRVETTDGVVVILPASRWERVQLFFLHLFA